MFAATSRSRTGSTTWFLTYGTACIASTISERWPTTSGTRRSARKTSRRCLRSGCMLVSRVSSPLLLLLQSHGPWNGLLTSMAGTQTIASRHCDRRWSVTPTLPPYRTSGQRASKFIWPTHLWSTLAGTTTQSWHGKMRGREKGSTSPGACLLSEGPSKSPSEIYPNSSCRQARSYLIIGRRETPFHGLLMCNVESE